MPHVVNLHKIIKLCVDLSALSVSEKADLLRDLNDHYIHCVLKRVEGKIPSEELQKITLTTDEGLSEDTSKRLVELIGKYVSSDEMNSVCITELESIAKNILSTTFKLLPLDAQQEVSYLIDGWL